MQMGGSSKSQEASYAPANAAVTRRAVVLAAAASPFVLRASPGRGIAEGVLDLAGELTHVRCWRLSRRPPASTSTSSVSRRRGASALARRKGQPAGGRALRRTRGDIHRRRGAKESLKPTRRRAPRTCPPRFKSAKGMWTAIADDPLVFMTNSQFLKEHNLRPRRHGTTCSIPPTRGCCRWPMRERRHGGDAHLFDLASQ